MSTAQPASATPILSEITFSAVAFRDNIGNYYFSEPITGRLSLFFDPDLSYSLTGTASDGLTVHTLSPGIYGDGPPPMVSMSWAYNPYAGLYVVFSDSASYSMWLPASVVRNTNAGVNSDPLAVVTWKGSNTPVLHSSEISYQVTIVPEPATAALFGSGVLALAILGRLRRRRD
jgi:hypothetical protein